MVDGPSLSADPNDPLSRNHAYNYNKSLRALYPQLYPQLLHQREGILLFACPLTDNHVLPCDFSECIVATNTVPLSCHLDTG